MNRTVTTRLHAVAGGIALLLTLAFLTSTIAAEVGGNEAAIAAVKRFIAYALLVLAPAMAVTGISGGKLAGRSRARAVLVKRRRTVFVAANGLLVLVPCALALHALANTGSFGPAFYVVQAVEFVAGPINVILIGLNVRDGMRLSGRLSRPKARL